MIGTPLLRITVDPSGFARMGNLLAAAGHNAPLALARAVNHTGAKARTAMARVLVKQTGLQYRTTQKALKQRQMWPGRSGAFVIYAAGGYIRPKFFRAREAGSGVVAFPRNRQTFYPNAFIKGGWHGPRKDLNMGGHVFRRVGKASLPIVSVKTDVLIPEEMVLGDSEKAFFAVVERDLPDRLAHELARLLG
jgi:hypothetical protein